MTKINFYVILLIIEVRPIKGESSRIVGIRETNNGNV